MVTPAKTPARRRPAGKSNEAAIDSLLKSLTLDEAGEARAAIARTLARKLDDSAGDSTGPVAMAVAGIAKGLREVVDEILAATGEDDAFVAGLFAPVGDPANI